MAPDPADVDDRVAVVRQHPHCPHCGWPIPPSEAIEAHPSPAWIAVHCEGCHWRGSAKFWTRQTDERP